MTVTLTVETSVNGVVTVPLDWSIDNHPAPAGSVLAVADQVICPWPVFKIPKLWGKGAPLCSADWKVIPTCESTITACEEETVMVTGTAICACPFETSTEPE